MRYGKMAHRRPKIIYLPIIMEPLDTQDLIDLYDGGMSLQKISVKHNLGIHIIKRKLTERGVKLRSRSESLKLRASKKIPPEVIHDLGRRYTNGESLAALARELGVDGNTLRVRFESSDIPIRSMREGVRLSNARKFTIEEEAEIVARYESGENVADLVKAFNYSGGNLPCKRYPNGSGIRGVLGRNGVTLHTVEAIRQKTWSQKTCPDARAAHVRPAQLAGAKMRERSLNVKMSSSELALFGALSMGPHNWVQQRAVDIYNLDISMDGLPIAVEVEIGAAFAEGRMSFAQKRIKHLASEGWLVIYVISGRRSLNLRRVAEKIHSFIHIASADETFFGKYGVIDCEGDILTSSRYDTDGVSRITSL